MNGFIENKAMLKLLIKKMNKKFCLILNDQAVCKEKFTNGNGVEPTGKAKQPYIQYEMAPKLKCPVFNPSNLTSDRLAYKFF